MALPRQPNFKIYDPRRGEDWEQEVSWGKPLSMRHHGILVVDYWPSRKRRLFELQDFEELILACIGATGSGAFLSVAPFTAELEQHAGIRSLAWQRADGSAIAYFSTEDAVLRRHATLLQLATYEDWVLGSCNARFDDIPVRGMLAKVVDWNIEFLFTQVEKIGCALLYSSETGIIRLYTRIFGELDEELRRLGSRRRD